MVFARVCAAIGLLGAVLVMVGSIGSWATLGDASVSGVDGGRDGWITLIFAILVSGLLAGIFAPKSVARVLRWFPLPVALLILLVVLLNIGDIASTNDTFTDQSSDAVFTLSIGWGLWLALAGGIAIGVVSAFLMFAPMPVPAHQAPPVPSAYVPGAVAPPGWNPQQAFPQQGHYPYPPQPYPGQHAPPAPPPPAPQPPAWPTTGPAYPGSLDPDDRSSS